MIKKVIHVAEDLDMTYTIFTAVEPSGTANVLRTLMNPNSAPVKNTNKNKHKKERKKDIFKSKTMYFYMRKL